MYLPFENCSELLHVALSFDWKNHWSSERGFNEIHFQLQRRLRILRLDRKSWKQILLEHPKLLPFNLQQFRNSLHRSSSPKQRSLSFRMCEVFGLLLHKTHETLTWDRIIVIYYFDYWAHFTWVERVCGIAYRKWQFLQNLSSRYNTSFL